jgi:LmbE family N-acetylglucosaminyl deacetylase
VAWPMQDSALASIETKKLLVVAAHPDDETLGAGGTIAKYVRNNFYVTVAFLTDGVSARGDHELVQRAIRRREAAIAAMGILGVTDTVFGDFPDNQLDTVPLIHVSQFLEQLHLKEYSCVITHHPRDLNVDHRIANEATNIAFRPQSGDAQLILNFETLSSTNWQPANTSSGFSPNWFEDISDTLDLKIEALSKYNDELRQWPHSRSLRAIRALAEYRGSSCGVHAAEGFELARKVV